MLYFAYGSNMDISRMKQRKTDFEYSSSAVLENYKLTFNKIAGGWSKYTKADDVYYPKLYEIKPVKSLWKNTEQHKYTTAVNKLAKYKTQVDEEGYATVEACEGEFVEGVLYVVPETGIVELDRYEGYPTQYNREVMKVKLTNGVYVDAIVYVSTPSCTGEGLIPSDKYLSYLLAGKQFLSDGYFKKLAAQRTIKDSYSSTNYSNYNTTTDDDDYYDGYYSRGYTNTSNPSGNYGNTGKTWNAKTRQYEYSDNYQRNLY